MYDIKTLEKLNAIKQENKAILAPKPPSVFGAKGQPVFVPGRKNEN